MNNVIERICNYALEFGAGKKLLAQYWLKVRELCDNVVVDKIIAKNDQTESGDDNETNSLSKLKENIMCGSRDENKKIST